VEYKNGERVHIPDDKRAKFKTRAGRTVLDGGGVQPDVPMEAEQQPLIVKKLREQDIIFKFVTQYCIGRDSIESLETFHFTDFAAFSAFLAKSDFKFETETDDLIKKIKEVSTSESYSSEVTSQVDQLKTVVEKEKAVQVKQHEKEILRAIEREILSRYYFETGLVRHQLKNDPELTEAIAILNSPPRYTAILQGK
jgi:carboxyl-terminal processing protease